MNNIKKIKKNYESGIALVEVIAALGVAVLVITALVSLSISTLRSSLNSKLLLEGSKIANREIELVRAYRDGRTWDDFISQIEQCSTPCSMNSNINVIPSPSTEGSLAETLTRSFTATKTDGSTKIEVTDKIVRISVSVTWKVGEETKGAYLYTDLSNWRSE